MVIENEAIRKKIERLSREIIDIRANNNSPEEIRIQARPIIEEIERLTGEGKKLSKKNDNGVYGVEGLAEISFKRGSEEVIYARVVILPLSKSDFCLMREPWIVGNKAPLAVAIKKTPVGGIGSYACKSKNNGKPTKCSIRVIEKSEGLMK